MRDSNQVILPGFKSKKIRVNLNQPIKAEVKQEATDVLKTVDEDRKYVIQATIVRIMKARKSMKNQQLIQEVISQISTRFAPKIPDIKKVCSCRFVLDIFSHILSRPSIPFWKRNIWSAWMVLATPLPMWRNFQHSVFLYSLFSHCSTISTLYI